MRVLRGRAASGDEDRAATARLVDWVAETGEPAVRVWRPGRQVAFGRRDTRSDGYDDACAAAADDGFPSVERRVGGRAVAYADSTVAFARIEPVEDFRTGLGERYDDLVTDVQRACWRLGAPAQRGEPPGSFCPGAHSLQYVGKLAGVAQRVTSSAALVSGVLVVDSHEELANVLDRVYGALGVPFDPATVGSLERAGGETRPERVLGELESALVGDAQYDVESVRQT